MRLPRATHPYVPMAKGFAYLGAILDLYTRKVLSFRVSNALIGEFCVEVLEETLARYGAPEIFNIGVIGPWSSSPSSSTFIPTRSGSGAPSCSSAPLRSSPRRWRSATPDWTSRACAPRSES
jgi:transposase InsO family protein